MDEEEIVIFTGSFLNGLYSPDGRPADLIDWCGVSPLSDEDHDKLYDQTNDIDILRDCINLNREEEEGPDIPLQSDTFLKFFVSSQEELSKLKTELKQNILELLAV